MDEESNSKTGEVGYRIFYLKGRGPAELIRYLLAFSGEPFQDCKLTLQQWKEIKGNDDRISLPLLEINGKGILCGYVQLAYFLGAKFDLLGSNEKETERIMNIVERVSRLQSQLNPLIRVSLARQEYYQKMEWELFLRRHLRSFLTEFEPVIKDKDKNWMIGGKLSVADLAIGEFLGRLEQCYDSLVLRDYPALRSLVRSVEDENGISEWCTQRPHTLY